MASVTKYYRSVCYYWSYLTGLQLATKIQGLCGQVCPALPLLGPGQSGQVAHLRLESVSQTPSQPLYLSQPFLALLGRVAAPPWSLNGATQICFLVSDPTVFKVDETCISDLKMKDKMSHK